MKNYIFVDENNVVQICSAGGKITGGNEVDNIPAEVWSCPQSYIYTNGQFSANLGYVPPPEELSPADRLSEMENKVLAYENRISGIETAIGKLKNAYSPERFGIT